MRIDIFHDTVCPWCRIGKQHLFDALEEWQGEPVDIRWRAFFLDDTIPAQGLEFRSFMESRKGVGPSEINRLFDYTRQVGEAAGVKLNFDKISLAPNSTLSHRLIALTPQTSKSAVVEAVYKAYFEDGLDIGDIDILVSLGKGIGMDSTKLQSCLSGDAALDEVVTDATLARLKGITSVPFFIINKLSVNGSQSVEVFLQALNRATLPQLSQVNSLW